MSGFLIHGKKRKNISGTAFTQDELELCGAQIRLLVKIRQLQFEVSRLIYRSASDAKLRYRSIRIAQKDLAPYREVVTSTSACLP